MLAQVDLLNRNVERLDYAGAVCNSRRLRTALCKIKCQPATVFGHIQQPGTSAGRLPSSSFCGCSRCMHSTHASQAFRIVPKRVATVRWIFEQYAAGWSPRRIAAELNARGVPSG